MLGPLSRRFVLSHFSWLLTVGVLVSFGVLLLPSAFYTDSLEDLVHLEGVVTYLFVTPNPNPAETVFTFQVEDVDRTFSVSGLTLGNSALLGTEKIGSEFQFSVERKKMTDPELAEVPVLSLSSAKATYLRGGGFAATFSKLRHLAGFFALVFFGAAFLLFRRLRAVGEVEKVDDLAIQFAKLLTSVGIRPAWTKEVLTQVAERELKLSKRSDLPKSKHAEAVLHLVSKGAVNAQNSSGLSALHISAQAEHLEAVDMLLRNGATVDVQDQDGNTPLILAAQGRSLGVVTKLLQSGASVLHKNKAGLSALDAVDRGRKDRVVGDIIKRAVEKQTALLEAIQKNDSDTIFRLVKSGAKVDMPNEQGLKPLTLAINAKCTEAVRRLLQLGAAVGEEELAASQAAGVQKIVDAVSVEFEKFQEKAKRQAELKEREKSVA